MKRDWLWDRKTSVSEARKILRDSDNRRFVLTAALFLGRKNNPEEVFKELDPVVFCKRWPEIKKTMKKDKWNASRVIFWQAIYERLLDKYREKGVRFRKDSALVRDLVCELVGKEIRRIRKEENLSQKELAHKTGISQQLISRIEKGRENISLITLKRISRALAKRVEINFIDA
ncbi:MAG: helix-turn-helix transcriptional regulator [Candidatus Omnitrophica bacterium]|nr:helix-turn-helix transcriptional regulator [Candidatus Omnitrophota bacterium]